jgi:hypothetical protein
VLNPGAEARFDVKAALANGFSGPVSITAHAADSAPLIVSVTQPEVTPSQPASLVVGAQPGGMPQSYEVIVTASGGGLERSAPITVTMLNPPGITSVTFTGKLLTISAGPLGDLPRVFINGVDQTDKIKRVQGSLITIKGKKRPLGLASGENRIRVVRGQAVSAEYILRI